MREQSKMYCVICMKSRSEQNTVVNNPNKHVIESKRKKGRSLTQSSDKSPYINRNVIER